MRYSLFLDDIRQPHDVKWIGLPLTEWTIARNYQEFIEIIVKKGLPEFIAFDHDLSTEHYVSVINLHNTKEIPYKHFKEKTGLDCAKWLCDYCLQRELAFPKYAVHSQNPIGKENIEKFLTSFKKHFNL